VAVRFCYNQIIFKARQQQHSELQVPQDQQ
jgi:hypothetical protein